MAVVEIQTETCASGERAEVADCVFFEGKAFVRGKFAADALEPMTTPALQAIHA